MPKTITVMIVDDSASVRAALSALIAEDAGLELIETASDPFEAVEKMRSVLPDVLLLDLHMPKMDGLTFLKKIMSQRPMPVVVVSSFTATGSEASLKALELGAAGVLLKPRIKTAEDRHEAAIAISDAVRAAVQTRGRRKKAPVPIAPGARHNADVVLPKMLARAPKNAAPLIAIGASTGGTDALRRVFDGLPGNLPPIAVVQHMPEGFTHAFAERLNRSSAVEISEAVDGAIIQPGQAVIARGNIHLALERHASGYRTKLLPGPNVARHRPSVDVLFRSVAQAAGASALGILLTGMGDDGAEGLGEMQATGAMTLAQDEKSSVVWGMPRAAHERGYADRLIALDHVPAEIASWLKLKERALSS